MTPKAAEKVRNSLCRCIWCIEVVWLNITVQEPDPFDFADPFDLLAKIPEKFASEEGIESKKWQERKEAVEVSLLLSPSTYIEISTKMFSFRVFTRS